MDGWPGWFSGYRPHQTQALEQIQDAYDRGAKVVVVEAPTGSGKTVIGEGARRNLDKRGLYVCSSISLQSQFTHDFPYSKEIKGRNNYPVLDSDVYEFPKFCAEDCDKENKVCTFCSEVDECPYQVAKLIAGMSELAVLNSTFYLYETNYTYGSLFGNRDFVVLDEADTVEGELTRFIELSISKLMLKKLGLSAPKKGTRYEKIKDWVNSDVIPRAKNKSKRSNQAKEKRTLKRLVDNLEKWVKEDADNWIRTGGEDEVVFKPVTVRDYGEKYLWRHSDKWLLMSATVISADQMMYDLGFKGQYEFVSVGSTFDKDKRPIYMAPIADMSKKRFEIERLKYGVEMLVRKHPDERILIHTVSYSIAKAISDYLREKFDRDIVTYTNSKDRQGAIDRYKETENAVMVASSLDRGIDLPDDLCRVIIIAKAPYPSLGDAQVSARLNEPGGQGWYGVQTVRSLVQMTGRGMRHKDDFCTTYILDKQFYFSIRNKYGKYLPKWWSEALITYSDIHTLQTQTQTQTQQ